ncbi:MAG: NUDIX hydrolase [Phycisphaerae bacterium]|nr:NUDIX hydrolase [Phycisphaerae bacterium]
MTTPPPTVVARDVLHAGRKFNFERLTIRTPAGATIHREIIRHPGAVVVVPILPDGRVVLIRVHRHALERDNVECCAGTIERGEAPDRCAARELIEETGYEAATLIPLGSFWTTPGMTDERMHAFVATGLRPVGQDLEEDETITVLPVASGEALAMIERGELADAKSMIAILLAERRGLLH